MTDSDRSQVAQQINVYRRAALALAMLAASTLIALPTLAAGRLNAPGSVGYLSGPREGAPEQVARDFLNENLAGLGITISDLESARVTNRYSSSHNDATHVYFQQMHAGIAVQRAVLNVTVMPDGRVLTVGNRFIAGVAVRAGSSVPALSAPAALAAAAQRLGLPVPSAVEILSEEEGLNRQTTLSGAGVSQWDVPAELVWVEGRSGQLRLAWSLGIYEHGGQHYWQVQVDAHSGEVISRFDLVESASFRVYPLPVESPTHTGDPFADQRSLVVDPEDDDPIDGASPAGWLTSTATIGPNCQAQTDLDANDAFTPGTDVRSDGGVTQTFDDLFDPTLGPETYREAAVANLFYWNNILHDIHHHYGFDVASGNFQGNDPVLADAQDGSGTNNANFLTLADGAPGIMQMFVWTPPAEVFVSSPFSANYPAGSAGFGAPLDDIGVTGTIELVNDGSAIPSEGCNALVGFTPGNIAIIRRGNCEFGTKVLNAENAGASGAIIVNNQGDATIGMAPGADGGSVTISSVSVGQTDGEELIAGLPATGTLRSLPVPARDSDFDNGVIAHEYGHGVSNRLTGGAAQFLCLSANQSGGMGEGWSDWHALAVTDTGADVGVGNGTAGRGVGSYVSFQPTDGPGIRVFPYSTDQNVNPLIYSDISGLSVPHGLGTVWASTLNDMYWNLVNKYGFDADKYRGTGGNNLAMQLVMDGMKNQPCDPSFLDARDGILAADLALNPTGDPDVPSDNYCEVWDAFAGRGMGVLSDDGGDPGSLAVTNDFSPPVACLPTALVANDDTAITPQDTAIVLDVLANDLGDGLTIDAVTDPPLGSVVINPGSPDTITYTPDPGIVGFDTFTYTARESGGDTAVATVSVEIECSGSGLSFADGFDPEPQAGWDVQTDVNNDALSPAWAVTPDGQAQSAPNSFFNASATDIKDDRLVAPPQAVSASSRLTFWHRYNFEDGFDGGVLEISTDGGAIWKDIESSDAAFVSGGYTGTIATDFDSPIAGRNAWTGISDPAMALVEVDLGALAGETVLVRWRAAYDNGFLTTGVGWWVDSVEISNLDDGSTCTPVACTFASPLFADGFESGDTSSWFRTRDPQGDLTIGAPAHPMEGSLAMSVAVDHNPPGTHEEEAWVLAKHAPVSNYCWSFWVDLGDLSIPEGSVFKLWGARASDNQRLLDLAVRNIPGGGMGLGLKVFRDTLAGVKLPFVEVPTDAPILVSGEWSVTGEGGVLRLYANGALLAEQTGIGNVNRLLNQPGMGNLGLFQAGSSGTLHLDGLLSGWTPPE